MQPIAALFFVPSFDSDIYIRFLSWRREIRFVDISVIVIKALLFKHVLLPDGSVLNGLPLLNGHAGFVELMRCYF